MNKQMKSIFSLLILTFNIGLIFSQSFEGGLTYKVKYELDSTLLNNFNFSDKISKTFYKPEIYNETINYVITDSLYLRNGYKKNDKKVIYREKDHTLYEFFKFKNKNERVRLTDTKIRYGTGESTIGDRIPAKIIEIDTIKNINGINCKLIEVDLGKFGKEQYWYNSDTLKINPKSFTNHNYEYLNEILSISKSFPIQMIKMTDNFCTLTLTLTKSEFYEVNKNDFEIPELKKLGKKEREFLELLNGINYMDVK